MVARVLKNSAARPVTEGHSLVIAYLRRHHRDFRRFIVHRHRVNRKLDCCVCLPRGFIVWKTVRHRLLPDFTVDEAFYVELRSGSSADHEKKNLINQLRQIIEPYSSNLSAAVGTRKKTTTSCLPVDTSRSQIV